MQFLKQDVHSSSSDLKTSLSGSRWVSLKTETEISGEHTCQLVHWFLFTAMKITRVHSSRRKKTLGGRFFFQFNVDLVIEGNAPK